MQAGRKVGSLAARRLGSLAVFGLVFGFRVRVRVFVERVFGLVFSVQGCGAGMNACSGVFLCSLCSDGVLQWCSVVFGFIL